MSKENTSEKDVMAALTGLQEQIRALDRKVDVLLGKAAVRPMPAPAVRTMPQAPVHAHDLVHAHDPVPGLVRPQPERRNRPAYQATCAECQKECEIPFKPSGDRPVYCKECFTRRKNEARAQGAAPKLPVHEPVAPSAEPVVPVEAEAPKAVVKEKKKSAAAKKPAARKKAVAKKKK